MALFSQKRPTLRPQKEAQVMGI